MSPTRWRRTTVSSMRLLAALALLFWSTAAIADPDAFSRPLPFLSDNDRATVHLGNSLFRKSWRPAPSATTASDGLGPLYNARSCADCHFRDGRGRPPNTGERALSLLLRLAPADPIYGRQLQNNAVDGRQPEGQVRVRYVERTVMLSGVRSCASASPSSGLRARLTVHLHPPTIGPAPRTARLRAWASGSDLGTRYLSGRRSAGSRRRRYFWTLCHRRRRCRPIWLEGGTTQYREPERESAIPRYWHWQPPAPGSLGRLYDGTNRMSGRPARRQSPP